MISHDFGATWIAAELDTPVNDGAWQNFRANVALPGAGYYEVWARATDSAGVMQPHAIDWNPKGYLNNTMHRVARAGIVSRHGRLLDMRRPWLLPLRPALPHRGIARTIRRGVVGTVAAFVVAACAGCKRKTGKLQRPKGRIKRKPLASVCSWRAKARQRPMLAAFPATPNAWSPSRAWTRQGWEEVIDLMVEEHGMSPIEDPYLDRVLGYLTTHYGPDRPNFPLQ